MSRRQRLTRVGALVAIVGALTGGLANLDAGQDRLGWTLVAGAGVGSVVLASRLRRLGAGGGEPKAARDRR